MMKKLLALLVLVTTIANAQYSIKGTMTPPDKGDWVILYKLEGAKQKFVTNTTIKFDTVNINGEKQALGKFMLTLPKITKPGYYRATYRNEGAGFVDFIFNKENVEFIFNPAYPDQSVVFTNSRENKLYSQYMQDIALAQKSIDSIQGMYFKSPTKSGRKEYKKALKKLEAVQDSYLNKSDGMLANNFIKASKRYNESSAIDNVDEYLASVKNNFFNNVDFNSKELYNSSFLIDRVFGYVFNLTFSDDQITRQKLYKEAIPKVMNQISNNNLKKEISEYFITLFADKRNSEIVDFIFAEYYDKLPNNIQDLKFKKKKLDLLLASVGRTAPDFSWKENGKNLKLSTLNDGENYLLIFWSTACSHCVKEIPLLYDFMKKHKNTSVIAFAIENDDLDFNEFTKRLYGWHNAYGTHPEHKWKNETVQKYQLIGTPSYFVLDKNKKIIASPDKIEDVEKYFSKSEESTKE